MKNKEVRTFTVKAEVRSAETDGRKTIVGLIPYNSRSLDMGFFEVITPTAFNKTLADKTDVKALFCHDDRKVLGRVGNDTLKLTSTPEGLLCECTLSEGDADGDQAYNKIKNKTVETMSFGFYPVAGKTNHTIENGEYVDYLLEVVLFEVSFCVPWPAYAETESEARNFRVLKKRGIDIDGLQSTLVKDELDDKDYLLLRSIRESIEGLLPKETTSPEPKSETRTEKEISEADSWSLVFRALSKKDK